MPALLPTKLEWNVPTKVMMLTGLAIVSMFAAAIGGPTAPYLAVLSVVLGITAIAVFVRWKHGSRYDLAALRDLHESGGPPPSGEDLPEVADDAGVVCPHCGTLYAAWMLVCPHCKR